MEERITEEVEFLRSIAVVARGVRDRNGVFSRTAEAIEAVLDYVSELEAMLPKGEI